MREEGGGGSEERVKERETNKWDLSKDGTRSCELTTGNLNS